MANPIPLSALPRPKTPEKYDRRVTEESLQWMERELSYKFDNRRDLYLAVGKSLVLTSATTNTAFKLGLDANDYLTLYNYSTGVAGTVVIDMPRVDGLAQEFIDVRDEFAAADGAISSAYIAADAVVASDAESARATLSTTLTAAYEAADTTTLASANSYTDTEVTAEGTARATAVDALQAQIGGGKNLIAYTRFDDVDPAGSASIDPRGWDGRANNGGMTGASVGVTGSAIGASNQPPGVRCFRFSQPAGVSSGYSDAIYIGRDGDGKEVPCVPGARYCASVYANAQNSSEIRVLLRFLDSSGTFISNGDNQDTANYSATQALGLAATLSPSDMERIWHFADAPSTAAYVAVQIYKAPHATSASFGFATLPMIEQATAEQTNPSVWSDGIRSADVTILREAFIDATTGEAHAAFDVEAAAGSFSAMLRMYAGDGTSSIGLFAEQLFLGSNTVFEDTYDTFHSTSASKRLRMMGPFGSSSDLVMWYGPTSVALNSETKTNGYFAMGTNGKIYIGSSAQGLYAASVTNTTTTTGTTFGTLSDFTITPQGGDGTYTYSCSIISNTKGIFTLNAGTTSTPYLTYSGLTNTGQYELCIVRCVVTETSTGLTATADHVCNLLYIPPP